MMKRIVGMAAVVTLLMLCILLPRVEGVGMYSIQTYNWYAFIDTSNGNHYTTASGGLVVAYEADLADTNGEGTNGTFYSTTADTGFYWGNLPTNVYDFVFRNDTDTLIVAQNVPVWGRTIGDSTITDSAQFKAEVVGTHAIRDWAVHTAHLDSAAVTKSKLAAQTVDSCRVTTAAINPVHIDWGTPAGQVSAKDMPVEEIATATYDDLQDWLNNTQSAGRISGGTISDLGDSSVAIAAGTGFIKTTDSAIGVTQFFDWAADSIVMTDDAVNYIFVDYNSGSPQPDTTTDRSSIELNRQFTLGRVSRDGVDLDIINSGCQLPNHERINHERLLAVRGFERASGGVVSEVTGRKLATTAGIFYLGANDITTSAQNTSDGDTFAYWYRAAGSGWTKVTGDSVIDNSHYDDGDGTLGTLTGNHYGVFWVYIHFDSDIHVIYGQDDYTLAEAENAIVPSSVPDAVGCFGTLASKIIILKNASTFTSIASAYETLFPVSSPVNHNDLGGLQGGAVGEYYHVPAAGAHAYIIVSDAGGDWQDVDPAGDVEIGPTGATLIQANVIDAERLESADNPASGDLVGVTAGDAFTHLTASERGIMAFADLDSTYMVETTFPAGTTMEWKQYKPGALAGDLCKDIFWIGTPRYPGLGTATYVFGCSCAVSDSLTFWRYPNTAGANGTDRIGAVVIRGWPWTDQPY